MGICQNTGAADVRVMTMDGATFSGDSADILFPISTGLQSIQRRKVQERMRATPGMHTDDNNADIVEILGTITAELGHYELDTWLPRALFNTENADQFTPGETPVEFIVQQEVGGIAKEFGGCVVNQMTITGEQRGDIQFAFDIIGKTAADVTGSAFNLNYDAADTPTPAQQRSIQFANGSFTHDGGSALPIKSFTFTLNNNLEADYYASSTPQCIERSGSREVTIALELASNSDSEGLIGQGGDGDNAVLSFVRGDGVEFTINLNGLKWEDASPTADGKGKLSININAVAHVIGSAVTEQEFYITNDPTTT